ncbi:hypothetical protein SLEP1_g56723 [Rubroshorea leprosula]|uniref:Uncharacterized protein n=1 Tax=Rubroshorea leprosula TaxID=152421 RepID=A0AAV5MJC8_9ROSI|nr:hypothetical protein SLEP1_g56723 [Rubroshorea leprosula]
MGKSRLREASTYQNLQEKKPDCSLGKAGGMEEGSSRVTQKLKEIRAIKEFAPTIGKSSNQTEQSRADPDSVEGWGKFLGSKCVIEQEKKEKSKLSHWFGFTRFLEVKKAKVLESQLDQIRIDGSKIWVNLAKYPVEALEVKGSRNLAPPNKVVKGKSYAEAVRGLDKEDLRVGDEHPLTTEPREAWVGMECNVKEEDFEWLRDCYVGVAHSVEIVPILQERFYMEGYFTCRLRAMGGKMVLLDYEDKEELKELVQGAASWLSQWFADVKPWSPSLVAKESLDDNTSKKRRFDVARILISTPIMESISVKRQIKVNGVLYNLMFTEEEASNSLFSMKYDFLPSIKSDSEYEESWSKGLDIEEEPGENGREDNRDSSTGDGNTAGDFPDQIGKDKRVPAIPDSEAYFEFEGDLHDEVCQKKKDMIYYSWIGEEESVEVVADSLEECLAGSDVGSRDEEETLAIESQNWVSSDPIEASKDAARSGWAKPNYHHPAHSQQNFGGLNEETRVCEATGSSKQDQLEAQQGISFHGQNLLVKKGKKREGLSRDGSTSASIDPESVEGNGEKQRDPSGKEGMASRRKLDRMKKKKKTLMCRSVYNRASILGFMSHKKKIKSGARSKNAPRQEMPSFMPNTSYSVVGGSVGDSGIENCNRLIKEHPSRRIAEELWDFAKQIGVTAKDEVETLRSLEGMEKRDREAKESEILKSVSKDLKVIEWGPKPFRFFDSWLEQEGYSKLIKEVWNDTQIQGWAGFRLKEKLKTTKEFLRKWRKNLIPALDLRINNATSDIAKIDMKGEETQLTKEEIERRREAFIQIWESLKSKESMKHQKSRKAWVAQGDANTRFFHNCVKGRWRRTEMNSIQIKGVQTRDANRMKEEIACYFEELYAEVKKDKPRLDGLGFKQLTREDNDILISSFSEEEIKAAVGECDSSKAPGPDGFNFRFVKSKWDVIKADVVRFLQEFQANGKLVRAMCKILAKLLANQLKKALENIYGEQQMAFLKGRQLMDGVVIANEKMGFCEKWRLWIQECLRSSLVSILVNGSPSRQFKVSRGGKRINWVKWENVCKEKQLGGLGVKDLRKFNLALLGKWWGRLVRDDKGHWGKVILEKYGKVGEPSFNWLREGFNYGSSWWRDICRLSDVEENNKGWLADGLEIRVGDGKGTSFWWDE